MYSLALSFSVSDLINQKDYDNSVLTSINIHNSLATFLSDNCENKDICDLYYLLVKSDINALVTEYHGKFNGKVVTNKPRSIDYKPQLSDFEPESEIKCQTGLPESLEKLYAMDYIQKEGSYVNTCIADNLILAFVSSDVDDNALSELEKAINHVIYLSQAGTTESGVFIRLAYGVYEFKKKFANFETAHGYLKEILEKPFALMSLVLKSDT